MKQMVRVGSRDSKLAVIQAEMVAKSIKLYNPEIEIKLVTMSSFGDNNLEKSIHGYNKADLFSDTLDRALHEKEIDIAVHSYKDLPTQSNPALPIVALSERENPFDTLVLPDNIDKPTRVIGTSCDRRALQLLALYPDWSIKNIRGTVPSRLEQMDKGDYDGLVLAVAGLKRLGANERIGHVFLAEEMVPSACQGVIAVQGRTGENHDYLRGFDCENSHIASRAELAFVRMLNNNVDSYNNGVYAEVKGENISMVGMYIKENDTIVKANIEGNVGECEALAESLARNLLDWRG